MNLSKLFPGFPRNNMPELRGIPDVHTQISFKKSQKRWLNNKQQLYSYSVLLCTSCHPLMQLGLVFHQPPSYSSKSTPDLRSSQFPFDGTCIPVATGSGEIPKISI